jgi:hypothetical protein
MSISAIWLKRITCDYCQWSKDVRPDYLDAEFYPEGAWFRVGERTYCDLHCRQKHEHQMQKDAEQARENARIAQELRAIRTSHRVTEQETTT